MTYLVQVGQTKQVAVANIVGIAVVVDVAVSGGALASGVEVGGGVRNTGEAEGRTVKRGSSRSVPTVFRPRHVVDDGVHEDPVDKWELENQPKKKKVDDFFERLDRTMSTSVAMGVTPVFFLSV